MKDTSYDVIRYILQINTYKNRQFRVFLLIIIKAQGNVMKLFRHNADGQCLPCNPQVFVLDNPSAKARHFSEACILSIIIIIFSWQRLKHCCGDPGEKQRCPGVRWQGWRWREGQDSRCIYDRIKQTWWQLAWGNGEERVGIVITAGPLTHSLRGVAMLFIELREARRRKGRWSGK